MVEMLNMAQRPYSSVILDVTSDQLNESQFQKATSKRRSHNLKKDCNYVPVAMETTANNLAAICTIFIRLPGQKRKLVCLGSSLIVQPKNNNFINKPSLRIAQQMI